MLTGGIELVRNAYTGKIAGYEILGDVLGFFRNATTDVIDSSELLKYNLETHTPGNLFHPTTYEWQTK